MPQANTAYCRVGLHEDAVLLRDHLHAGFYLHRERTDHFTGTLLDTFSGHLRSAGKMLLQLPDKALLVDPRMGEFQTQDCPEGWTFAKEVDGGIIGYQLAEMTTLRAFTPICKVTVDQFNLVLFNELEKTVLRARKTMVMREDLQSTWMALKPLRGYDRERDLFIDALKASGYVACDTGMDYDALIGLDAARYESRPDIAFDGETPVYESATLIAQTYLNVARLNEDGVLADTDTEFLHDFRVSLRRIRSMLSLFSQVYEEHDGQQIKSELVYIMKQTNRLRDLDVYLMQRSSFFELVPESMYPGMETLFEIFEHERHAAYVQLCAYLQSDEYLKRIQHIYQRFAREQGMAKGYRANETAGRYAGETILKRYRKVAKITRSIDADTPDETVHMLRIQCKKLRYLMEFFTPLFPPRPMKKLVKSLKGLQDLLGTFNDCSVQRESLTQFVADHPLRGKKGMMLAESVGALVATLYQKQIRVRSEIDAALDDFVNKQTNRDFKTLFSVETSK